MKSRKAQIQVKVHKIPVIRFEDQKLTSFSGLLIFQALFSRINLKRRLKLTLISGSFYPFVFILSLFAGQGYSQIGALTVAIFFLIPLAEIGMEWLVQRRMGSRQLEAQTSNIRYANWVNQQNRTYTTYSIVILIGAVGVGQLLFSIDHSIDTAGLVKTAVRSGQVWRLLTAAFIHGSILHFISRTSADW